MARIKGRYVAQIEIDIDYTDDGSYDNDGMLPFEEVKERVIGGELHDAIKQLLNEEIAYPGSGMTMNLTMQYADLYKVEDDDE